MIRKIILAIIAFLLPLELAFPEAKNRKKIEALNELNSGHYSVTDRKCKATLPEDSSDLEDNGYTERLQLKIWELRENGKTREAEELEGQLKLILKQEPFEEGLELNSSGHPTQANLSIFKDSKGKVVLAVKKDASLDKHEVAAYMVDKLFGFNLVPLTVYRGEDKATFQLYMGGKYVPASSSTLSIAELYESKSKKLRFLDYLLNNVDRHPGNWLRVKGAGFMGGSESMREVAIDHDHKSFVLNKDFQKSLETQVLEERKEKKNQESDIIMTDNRRKIVPQNVVIGQFKRYNPGPEILSRLRTVPKKKIIEALSPYLSKQEIRELIKRKEEYIKRYSK